MPHRPQARGALRLLVFACAALALALPAVPAQANKADDTLRVVWGSNGPLESVDLYFSTRRTGMEIAGLVWDTLVWRDPDSFEYKPLLAKSWKQVDERTLEFTLRDDVTFHDGTKFTAADVAGTLSRVADPAFKVRVPRNVNWIDSVVAVSPTVARVVSKKPFPPALDYIANTLPIYPAEYYAKVGPEGMHAHPIGTGPYRMVSVETAKAYRMVRNDSYMRGSPKGDHFIGTIDVREVPDGQTQVAELLAHHADIMWEISTDQTQQIARRKGFQVLQTETMRTAYLGLDAAGRSGPALTNLDVRRAIAYAVNREAIVKNLMGGPARVLDAPCYPKMFGCVTEAAHKYPYDPAKARELLSRANVGPVSFDFYVYPLMESVAEAVASDLGKVGITARMRTMEYPALHDAQFADKVPLVLLSWGAYSVNDASAMIGMFFTPGKEDYARDPDLHAWLGQAESTVDPAIRKELYAKSIERITDRVYWLPMFSFVLNYVFTDEVNFKASADEFTRLYRVQWK